MSLDPARPGELRDDDPYTTALYRAAIGPVNTAYYLSLFAQWELEQRRQTRWNWAAALVTLDWLIFRKLGLHAMAYLGAVAASVLLVIYLGTAWMGFSSPALWGLTVSIVLIAVLVPGLLGNRWFQVACNKNMTAALRTNTDVARACEALEHHASRRQRGIVIAAVHSTGLLVLGLVATQFAEFSQRAGVRPGPAVNHPSPQMARGLVMQSASAPAPATATAVSAPVFVAHAPASAPRAATSAPSLKIPVFTAKASPGYLINVGLFAVARNAQAAKEKLEAQKLPVTTDTLEMSNGPRIRVRCGPFDTKEQAQAAAIKIRALGLEAVFSEP